MEWFSYKYYFLLIDFILFSTDVPSGELSKLKPLLEKIQDEARLYMVLLDGEKAEELRRFFKIPRNLMVVNKKDDHLVGLTKLTKALGENIGT